VFPLRGHASLSSLYSAAELFREKQAEGKKIYLYYFGDSDPSGIDIDRSALANLRNDFDVEVVFERVAVTEAQITEYQLPTRPTKPRDSRAKGFRGRSVEVDAMSREVLLALVEQCITQHMPDGIRARLDETERTQRESWGLWVAALAELEAQDAQSSAGDPHEPP